MVERSLGLDLIRAIAVILVLVNHSAITSVFGVHLGWVGVEIFFVLSGFLIGQILIKDFLEGITYRKLFRFWIRRWLRTLPMYYIAILVKFIFIDNSLGPKILVYFVFLQNNFVGVGFYSVSWSLVIEEWFYLILPVTLFIFFRSGISKSIRKFFLFCFLFILAVNFLRLGWVLYTDRPWGALLGNFPFRLDSLLAGVLIAGFKRLSPEIYSGFFLKQQVFFLGLLFCLISFFLLGFIDKTTGKDISVWYRTGMFFTLSFSFSLVIPYLDKFFIVKRNFLSASITWISLISYSLYLLHPLVFKYTPSLGIHSVDILWKNLVCILVCSVTYLFIEKPIMDLREKIKFEP